MILCYFAKCPNFFRIMAVGEVDYCRDFACSSHDGETESMDKPAKCGLTCNI